MAKSGRPNHPKNRNSNTSYIGRPKVSERNYSANTNINRYILNSNSPDMESLKAMADQAQREAMETQVQKEVIEHSASYNMINSNPLFKGYDITGPGGTASVVEGGVNMAKKVRTAYNDEALKTITEVRAARDRALREAAEGSAHSFLKMGIGIATIAGIGMLAKNMSDRKGHQSNQELYGQRRSYS